jgi:hypothetical protein
MHPEWIVRGLNMLNDFSCQDADDITRTNERARTKMDERTRTDINERARVNREEDRQGVDVAGWVKEVKDLVAKWEGEVAGKSGRILCHRHREPRLIYTTYVFTLTQTSPHLEYW